MRKTLCLLLAALLALALFGCGEEVEPELVWQVESTTTHYTLGALNELWESRNSYDEKGRLTERTIFVNSELYETGTYTIDETGEHSTETITYADGTIAEREYTQTYDEAGRLLSVESRGHGDDFRSEWAYDDMGNTISSTLSRGTGESNVNTHIMEYDSENRLIKSTHYVDDELSGVETTEYGENGKPLRKVNTAADGTVVTTTDYSYDGNVETQDQVDSQGVKIRYVLTYDENGNLSSKEVFRDGEQWFIESYTYVQVPKL